MSEQLVEQELNQVDQNSRPNHIILLTVLNALCPISVQVISKVTQPIGKVLRIVIFKCGTVVQSMVEFDSIETANLAKNKLHGCDIFRGSCTLKVEFAKTAERLNVRRNDDMTWDYTDEWASGWVQHCDSMEEEMDVWRNGRVERWRNVTEDHLRKQQGQENSWQ